MQQYSAVTAHIRAPLLHEPHLLNCTDNWKRNILKILQLVVTASYIYSFWIPCLVAVVDCGGAR